MLRRMRPEATCSVSPSTRQVVTYQEIRASTSTTPTMTRSTTSPWPPLPFFDDETCWAARMATKPRNARPIRTMGDNGLNRCGVVGSMPLCSSDPRRLRLAQRRQLVAQTGGLVRP